MNTGLNQDLRFGESDPSAQLNLRYRHNNLDLFGMVNYWKWDQTTLFTDEQSNYLPTDRDILNINQNSHSWNHFKNNGIDYNLGFNWQIAENHSTGVRIQRNDRFNATTDLMLESDIERQPLLKKEHNYSTQDEHRHTFYNWEGNAYYNGQVGKMGIDLNIDGLFDEDKDGIIR